MTNPAYFVIDVKINDPEALKPYLATAEQTLKAFGGKRIVASSKVDVLEGRSPQGHIVIVQFPSLENAHAWHESPEYQAIVHYRHRAADSHAYLVEGLPVSADA